LAELKRLRKAKSDAAASPDHAGEPTRDFRKGPAAEVAQALLTGEFTRQKCEWASGEHPLPEAAGNRATDALGEDSLLLAPRQGGKPEWSSSVHLPGQSETATLSDSGRQYWDSVARIGVQVAEAPAYAHAQRTLHRDIKPSNLLLDTQGTVWITDFGLAKAADSDDLTRTGDMWARCVTWRRSASRASRTPAATCTAWE
jgi:hypothetical protein